MFMNLNVLQGMMISFTCQARLQSLVIQSNTNLDMIVNIFCRCD